MESDTEGTAPPEAPKGKPIVKYAVIAIGLAAGSAAGVFGVAPMFSKHAAAAETTALKPGKEGKEGKDGKAEDAKALHVVDNLVLNPAGSGGTRFLMVNATFELKDASQLETMKARDAEVRDVLLALLGSKTVDQLTDMATRDSLKKEMMGALGKLFPTTQIRRVYFPQFVIQ